MNRRESVRFPGHDDVSLAGLLHLPPSPVAAVVLAHCFTCSKQQLTTARLAKGLESAGHAVLRFDFAGLGQSGGAFEDTSLMTMRDDVRGAVRYVARRGLPVLLAGHSLGGVAALLATPSEPDVRAIATLASPSDPAHVARLLAPAALAALREGRSVPLTVDGRRFVLGPAFAAGLDAVDGLEPARGLGRPLLVVHGAADAVVPVSEAARLCAQADGPADLEVVDGADHLFSARPHADRIAHLVANWFVQALA